MAAEERYGSDPLPPDDTIREAFYHPRLGAVLICSRPGTLGVRPTYWRTKVHQPSWAYLQTLGNWLWLHVGAGMPDGPCWN